MVSRALIELPSLIPCRRAVLFIIIYLCEGMHIQNNTVVILLETYKEQIVVLCSVITLAWPWTSVGKVSTSINQILLPRCSPAKCVKTKGQITYTCHVNHYEYALIDWTWTPPTFHKIWISFKVASPNTHNSDVTDATNLCTYLNNLIGACVNKREPDLC